MLVGLERLVYTEGWKVWARAELVKTWASFRWSDVHVYQLALESYDLLESPDNLEPLYVYPGLVRLSLSCTTRGV